MAMASFNPRPSSLRLPVLCCTAYKRIVVEIAQWSEFKPEAVGSIPSFPGNC